MRKKLLSKLQIPGVIIFILMVGCPVTPDNSKDLSLLNNPVLEENSSLFDLDTVTGIVSFETNNTLYSTEYGYTLWTENNEEQNPFTNLNVTLSKLGGNSDAGYGIIFCSYDETMLVVLINTKKEYIIGELTGNLFTELVPWTHISSLKAGLNQINTINISLVSGEFSLTFNAGESITFSDTDEPYHSYGKDGYIVVISPLDDFPNFPVSVTFKKN